MTNTTTTAAVIALGRHDRGDDAAGLLVADILRRRLPHDVTVVAAPAGLAELTDVWWHDVVFVIDALRPGHEPGAVHRFDPAAGDPPAPRCDLHELSLADVVTGARTRDVPPRKVVVIGIEGRWFTAQAGMSPEVCGAVHDVADEIVGAVAR